MTMTTAPLSPTIRPVTRLLVANRGEIARRVIRTCRRLGISTVAVYSHADRHAPYVREADLAMPLPGNTAAETYLRADLLVQAALATGCTAVHPGYGFLSENAAFARTVHEAGLVFVGPPADAIEAMGSKIGAKQMMRTAGVPVLPDNTVESLAEIGLPALVKASAGGGGRGMRLVRTADELDDAIAAAQRERPRRSATARCSSSATWKAVATSRSRCSPTTTATPWPCSNATARCSAATRRSSKRLRRPPSAHSCASG